MVAVGPSGPPQVLAAPVVVPMGEDRSFIVHFDLPQGAEEVVVGPSARVHPVRWDLGDLRWADETARTVAFSASDRQR